MAVVYSKVLLFDPPLIYTAPDICVFGAVILAVISANIHDIYLNTQLSTLHFVINIVGIYAGSDLGPSRKFKIFFF